jgi:hypothetical protein
LDEAVKIVSLIRTFYEKHFDGVVCSTQHILDACSPQLAKVLDTFEWFDQKNRIFCDIPLPNLITDLLLGLYGFPYHVNVQKLQRFAYKAKETVMFTDILVLDQARYMYDLLPTLPLFNTETSACPSSLCSEPAWIRCTGIATTAAMIFFGGARLRARARKDSHCGFLRHVKAWEIRVWSFRNPTRTAMKATDARRTLMNLFS